MNEHIVIISPYPPKEKLYGSTYSALASFARNTIQSLQSKKTDIHITVIADKITNSPSYSDGNIHTLRVWKRNSVVAYLHIFKALLSNWSAKKIMVESEWCLLGNSPYILSMMPVFLGILRMFGKEIYIVLHEVLLNFDDIAPQLSIQERSLLSKFYNHALKLYYFGLVLFSKKIIVLEKRFETLLHQYFGTSKTIFIPHGVDTKVKILNKNDAKKRLNIDTNTFVIMHFGFFNWYKGTDIMVDLYKNTSPSKSLLIIGGGVSEIHKKDSVYKAFTEKITTSANMRTDIRITGFIPDEKLHLYFSAADILIFPYRTFISSSGPLSLAFSYERPVLLSNALQEYADSPDIKNALFESGIQAVDLFCDTEDKSFHEALVRSKKIREKLQLFSKTMKRFRSWDRVAEKYAHVLELEN